MTFGIFLMAVGLVGVSFLAGIMLRALGISATISGMGVWLAAMLFMGTIAVINLTISPVIEPLALQFALLIGVPLAVGFAGLSCALRRNPHVPSE